MRFRILLTAIVLAWSNANAAGSPEEVQRDQEELRRLTIQVRSELDRTTANPPQKKFVQDLMTRANALLD